MDVLFVRTIPVVTHANLGLNSSILLANNVFPILIASEKQVLAQLVRLDCTQQWVHQFASPVLMVAVAVMITVHAFYAQLDFSLIISLASNVRTIHLALEERILALSVQTIVKAVLTYQLAKHVQSDMSW
jgi:hypothetical protein